MIKKISENTKLERVLKYPKLEEVLVKHHVPCLVCPFATIEMGELTIGGVCKRYNIDAESVIKDLNKNLN